MYASCWLLTKIENLPRPNSTRGSSVDLEKLEI
jgi:hypothetical protein